MISAKLRQCDMISKNKMLQNLGIMEMSQKLPLPGNVLLKHISVVMNACKTVEDCQRQCFLVSPQQAKVS
jgi:hypothetical protein